MRLSLTRSSSEFDRVLSSLRQRLAQDSDILLDDGRFYVERSRADCGFMASHCGADNPPCGYIGSYFMLCSGEWSCNFPAGVDDSLIDPSKTLEDAIALLWFSRTLIS